MTSLWTERKVLEKSIVSRTDEARHTEIAVFVLRIASAVLLTITLVMIALAKGKYKPFPVHLGTRCGAKAKKAFDGLGNCKHFERYNILHWVGLSEEEENTLRDINRNVRQNVSKPPNEAGWRKIVKSAEEDIKNAARTLMGQIAVFCILGILLLGTIGSIIRLRILGHSNKFLLDKALTFSGWLICGMSYGAELYYTHGFGHLAAWCRLLKVLCDGHCDNTKRSLLIKTWGVGSLLLLITAFTFIMDAILILTLVRLRKDIVESNEDLKKIEKLEAEEKEKAGARRRERPDSFVSDCQIEFAVPRTSEDTPENSRSAFTRSKTQDGVPTREYLLNMSSTLQENLAEFLPTMRDKPGSVGPDWAKGRTEAAEDSELLITMDHPPPPPADPPLPFQSSPTPSPSMTPETDGTQATSAYRETDSRLTSTMYTSQPNTTDSKETGMESDLKSKSSKAVYYDSHLE